MTGEDSFYELAKSEDELYLEVKEQTKEQILSEYDGEDRVVVCTELKKRYSTDLSNLTYKYGIPSLDKYTEGVQGGELTVLSGQTGQGKTLLAQSFTREFEVEDIGCLWFTYEVMPQQFLRQFGESLPIFYMPNVLKGNALEWIEERIYESFLKYDTKVVFIDHLHYLIDLDMKHNVSLEIGKVMRFLKKLCIKYVQAIFVISHMTKVVQDKEPDIEHLRDSALTGCEADNVFFIWRKKSNPQEAILKISKARRTGAMNKKIHLIKSGNFLGELNNREDEDD